jgi:MFS family permease
MRELISFMRGLHGEARAFFWLSRAVGFGFQGVYLAGFNLYLLRLGYGRDFAGVAFGIAIFSVAGGAYLAGRFTGSPRSMVIAGQVMMIVAYTAIALTDLLPEAMQTPWLLCGDAVGGLAGAVFTVGRLPYLMSITTADNRMAAFALDQVGQGVAGLCGGLVTTFVPPVVASALGTTLDDPAPFRFAILTAPLVLIFAVLWFVRAGGPRPGVPAGSVEPSHPRAPEAAAGGDDVEQTASRAAALILAMTVVGLLFSLGDTAPNFFFNVYMDDELKVSPTTTTLTMSIARVITLIPILVLPVLGRRWSHFSITAVLASLLAFAVLPLALIRHELVAAASYLVYSMFRGAFDPAFEVLRMSIVSPRWHTRMASRVQTSIAFAMGLSGVISGLVSAKLGFLPVFLGACALITAAVLVLLTARGSIDSSRTHTSS